MIRPLLCLPLAALLLAATPAAAQPDGLEKQARKLHALASGGYCEPLENAHDAESAYQSWTFSYDLYPGAASDQEEITLIRIWCMTGAYNEVHAYYTYRNYEGLATLSFAVPAYETTYEDDEPIEGRLEDLTVLGFNATTILTNSQYDPKTRTISDYSLWRGIGDASSSGTWNFNDGEWTLQRYEIDASYDGESNPETVVDYTE
ncbi:DUF1176 domain-containing protein [Devosia sp.]|uniref:DUF1176 domain-containing protein n=1 Tax=Devosia sp. TaxID=1871048 RepID=UPI0025E14573|nr:DUF1176 domain-containing protein [Devosia sp.]MCR6634948.1 DUF1176 domain-containing protein [Devosia sp.]